MIPPRAVLNLVCQTANIEVHAERTTMRELTRKALFISAAIAGALAIVINLLVEWALNGRLVSGDLVISLVAGALTALAVLVIFRGRVTRERP